MKSFIKSSFLAILFVAVFCVGFSSTYAKNANPAKTVTKTTKVTNIKTVPLRCQMQAVSAILSNSFINSYNPINKAKSGCVTSAEPTANGNTIVVTADCRIYLITSDNKVYRLL